MIRDGQFEDFSALARIKTVRNLCTAIRRIKQSWVGNWKRTQTAYCPIHGANYAFGGHPVRRLLGVKGLLNPSKSLTIRFRTVFIRASAEKSSNCPSLIKMTSTSISITPYRFLYLYPMSIMMQL